MLLLPFLYTAVSRNVVGKKHKSARDKTERWSGYTLEFCILALRNVQVCIFEREEFVFPLRRLFSEALLLLSHAFEF